MLNIQRFALLNAVFMVLSTNSIAQDFFRLDIPVIKSGQRLTMPLIGGLNAPQLSKTDLNGDGVFDLYIFDRVGGVHLPFLKDDDSFTYVPDYADNFPDLEHWVLLRDYNGDGIEDLFAFSDIPGINGIQVYQGYYENDSLKFERINFENSTGFNVLPTRLRTGGRVPLYVSTIDYPDINDVDCDGDLDILTFNVAGGVVEFHANQSIERGFGLDTLLFEVKDNCWGGFFESGISELVDLSDVAGECFNNLLPKEEQVEPRHAGSTVLSVDLNGDDAKELILGDISFSNLVQLQNGGTCEDAWMNDQVSFFPATDLAVDIPFFPASFYLDIGNDGKKDFLAAPNAEQGAEDIEVLWYYENLSTNDLPDFKFVQKDFLVGEMLDFGTGANPVFIDYNADGLKDLVVGNGSSYQNPNSRLILLENVGDQTQPVFEIIDTNYLNLSQLTMNDLNPHFADLDNDQDLDLLLGNNIGTLIFLENLAGKNQTLQFGTPILNYSDIDVGNVSSPTIEDIDFDGLPDLIIGEKDGNVNFFKNRGTPGSPKFEPEPDNAFWGSIDTRNTNQFALEGNSKPTFFDTNDGINHLVLGSKSGRLFHYELKNLEDNMLPVINDQINQIKEGYNSKIDFADIDEDGLMEAVIGNQRGGITIYQTNYESQRMTTAIDDLDEIEEILVFPNPASGKLNVRVNQDHWTFSLINSIGNLVFKQSMSGYEQELDLEDLPRGVYYYIVDVKQKRISGKVVLVALD